MSLTLLSATPNDIPQLVTIYFAAFQNILSLNRFPRTSAVRTWREKLLHDAVTKDPNARVLKIVKDDKIIAYAQWCMPVDDPEDSAKQDEMPVWPEDGDTELCAETFQVMVAARRELMGWRPHFCKHDRCFPCQTSNDLSGNGIKLTPPLQLWKC